QTTFMNVVQTLLAHLDIEGLQFPRQQRDKRDLVQRPSSSPTRRGFVVFAAAFWLAMISTPAWAATTYTWNQTGSASWATAGNWTPTRTTPATDDILVFNNGATTTA